MSAVRRLARMESEADRVFLETWLEAQTGVTLLSIEGPLFLPSHMQIDAARRLSSVFKAFSPTLLVTLRDPEHFFRSLYQEVVKGDLYTHPAEYLGAANDSIHFQYPPWAAEDLSLDRLVQPYLDSFDKVLLVKLSALGSPDWLEVYLDTKFSMPLRHKLEKLAGEVQNRGLSSLDVHRFEKINRFVKSLLRTKNESRHGWMAWSQAPFGSKQTVTRTLVALKYRFATAIAAREIIHSPFNLPSDVATKIKSRQESGPVNRFLATNEDFHWVKQ